MRQGAFLNETVISYVILEKIFLLMSSFVNNSYYDIPVLLLYITLTRKY